MIVYKKGDLFDDINPRDIILHNTNCFNCWGTGFARTASSELVNLYRLDLDSKKGDFQKLGTFISATETLAGVDGDDDKFTSVLVYGQYTYSRERKVLVYEKLAEALLAVNDELLKKKNKLTVKMPKIGGGLAGGEWKTIENIIKGTLTNAKDVIIYDPKM